jgi:hypothetical protein
MREVTGCPHPLRVSIAGAFFINELATQKYLASG